MIRLPNTPVGNCIAALWAIASLSVLVFAYVGRGEPDSDMFVAWALLVLCFPISLAVNALLVGVLYLLDVWFGLVVPGGLGHNVVMWGLFVVAGYVQWQVFLPHLFAKTKKLAGA
jgi:hypothetical protein